MSAVWRYFKIPMTTKVAPAAALPPALCLRRSRRAATHYFRRYSSKPATKSVTNEERTS